MQKNTVVFLVLSFLILIGWFFLQRWLNPPQPAKPLPPNPAVAKKPDKPDQPGAEAKPPAPVVLAAPPPRRTQPFLTLGDEHSALRITLDPRGGGVRQVICNHFKKADDMGRPVPNENLELVPEEENREEPSNLLFHYPRGNSDRPLDTLGREEWTPRVLEQQWKVAFIYNKLPDVILTKTYSLAPDDYHIELDVKVERKLVSDSALPFLQAVPVPGLLSFVAQQAALSGKLNFDPVSFQYQLTSAHGLPIEGKWYTSIFRNALVGQAEVGQKENLWRDMQDLRTISRKQGGDTVNCDQGKFIRYAGVAVQYFGSMIVVSDNQEAGVGTEFLLRAQSTIESAVARGKIRTISPDMTRFDLPVDKLLYTFLVPRWDLGLRTKLSERKLGEEVVVRYRIEGDSLVVTELLAGEEAERLFFDDISVRVVSRPFDVKAGAPVVHKYWLYNGPLKVRQLADKGVTDEKIQTYKDLGLSTLTDYHSNGWAGEFASRIYWSDLLIKTTNLMHGVLGFLHRYIMPWSWGLCIIMLTVLVRGMMFPVSRKQAMTTMKMQTLAPEIKKLQEKYKGDRQALGMAQMELYRKHGLNPLGSCWLLVLQMPIFLGLYYCLQESIDFRLSEFLWIKNLAAPDMLVSWGQSIPWLSRPEDYGGFLYLGPYFNLLPVFAVALMIAQQQFLMPPAVDEQQQMQQKMMKYMMVFFGFLFYKVAAGLCLYFIASSVWGFTERKLLPKKKMGGPLPDVPARKPGLLQRLLSRLEAQKAPQANGAAGRANLSWSAATPASKRRKRNQDRERQSTLGAPLPPQESGGWLAGIRVWWADVLKRAEKKR